MLIYCDAQPLTFTTDRDPDGGKHVVKSSTANRFENTKKLQQPLADSTYLRAIRDSSAEHSLFVYDYLTNNVLRAVHRLGTALPHAARKRILRDTLRGIAELHSRGIFHGDIKPNNILLDIKEASAGSAEAEVGSGKLGDLESALALPPRTWIVCSHRIGNYMWCSPEAHLCEKINTPTDIFSFAITVGPLSLSFCLSPHRLTSSASMSCSTWLCSPSLNQLKTTPMRDQPTPSRSSSPTLPT